MGSGREGYNLSNKYGRQHFIKNFCFRRMFWNYVYMDNLGKFVCSIFGHTKTFETDDYPSRIVCGRCLREVNK